MAKIKPALPYFLLYSKFENGQTLTNPVTLNIKPGTVLINMMRNNLFLFYFSVPDNSVSTVQGSSVELPCNVTAPLDGDSVRLVLWFKNESSLPIYT